MSPFPDPVLRSPDGRVEARFARGDWRVDGQRFADSPLWEVFHSGRPILNVSPAGLALAGHPPFTGGFVLLRRSIRRGHRAWQPVFGDAAALSLHYREETVALRERSAPGRRIDVILRCYDEGVCMRARLPRQRGLWRVPPAGSGLSLRLPAGTLAWTTSGLLSATPGATPLDRLDGPVALPVSLNFPHGRFACLWAAGGCRLQPLPDRGTWSPQFEPADGLEPTPYEGPWVACLLADRPAGLPANTAMLQHLVAEVGSAPARNPATNRVFNHAWADCAVPFVDYPVWRALAGLRDAVAPDGSDAESDRTPVHRMAFDLVCGRSRPRWDETRFLRGEIGEYAVVARRAGSVWQVGAITGAEGRVLTVRLADFLPGDPARTYTLTVLRDPLPGETRPRDGVVREDFAGVDAEDRPRFELPRGGGILLRLEPASWVGG